MIERPLFSSFTDGRIGFRVVITSRRTMIVRNKWEGNKYFTYTAAFAAGA